MAFWLELDPTEPCGMMNISKSLSLNKHGRPLFLQQLIINIERPQKPEQVVLQPTVEQRRRAHHATPGGG